MIAEIKAKEFTFSSFANPENLMGFSTLQKWEWQIFGMQIWYNFQWKTNTGERLDTIEQFQSRSSILYTALLRLEYALSSWQRMQDIEKDRSMGVFLMSPEAKYMLALSGWLPVDTAMQEYNLHKARELKNFIINGDILAESYYDKLKGTPYEKETDKERMGMLEYARKKWLTDFGDTFLSLDQLGFLVAWWAIWKWVWATIAMSPKLAQLSVWATEKLNNGIPWVITRVVPWVNVVKTQAGEWVATTLTKFGFNFPLEIGKFAWYEALAKQFWGDDTAQIVAMLMMVMPWAREGFASSLRAKAAKDWKQIRSGELKWEFVKWIQVNYWGDKAKQMLYAGLVEAKMQTFKKIKNGYDIEVANTVETIMKNISGKAPEVKWVPTKIDQAISSVYKSKNELGFDITKNEIYSQWQYTPLRDHANFLWELKHWDVLWHWINAIVVRHPTREWYVVKIPKRWWDDVVKETMNHNKAYMALRQWKKEWIIPDTIEIPEIQIWTENQKNYFLIKKID